MKTYTYTIKVKNKLKQYCELKKNVNYTRKETFVIGVKEHRKKSENQ